MKAILIKKTHEVTAGEWQEITDGFNEEFKKEKSAEDLIRYYSSNGMGYSYHGMAKDEQGTLAGFTTVIPTSYNNKTGTIFKVGLSGSTFVKKDFRNDIFIFQDIYNELRIDCAKDGFKAILGVPNKNSFRYLIKLLNFKLLFNLPYFVLPIRLKNIFSNKLAKSFSLLFFLLVWSYTKLISLLALLYNPKEIESLFNIFFTDEAYRLRFNESYKNVSDTNYTFTYRIYDEKNIKTAYLFDFRQKGKRSFKALSKAVNFIIANEKIDIIAFVGKLDLKQFLLLKLPKSKEPQQLPLTIDLLVDESDSFCSSYIHPSNWNFGLLNFDVR